MAIDRRILDGIESCRPGSDDLQSPELAEVARAVRDDQEAQAAYARVQQRDAAIRAVMDQVPVPGGLAQRILEALAGSADGASQATNGTLAGALAAVQAAGPADVEATTTSPPVRLAWSRRDWLAIGAALAATVVVAVTVQRYVGTGDELPLDAMADRWLSELGPAWRPMEKTPKGFVVPAAITAEVTGWQSVGQVRGVAYKLVHPTGGTARLFVVRMATGGLPGSPPAAPQANTGGRSIAYWQTGGLVYVLVVEGDKRDYRSFVNSTPMPVA